MFEKLEILGLANGLLRHSTDRQSVIARNVANADTPGFRARDVASFADTFRTGGPDVDMRATRVGHLGEQNNTTESQKTVFAAGESSPNGNTVSLESEMVKSAEVRHQYDLALSVYSSSLKILRTSLGRS